MKKSEEIKNISKALALFQAKVEVIDKKAKNPFFKSDYADLPTILEGIRIPLEESELCFSQHPDGEYLTTILIHYPSGEFFESSQVLKPVKNDPQAQGSAITYARRYAIGSILGLSIDKDDDAEKAMNRKAKKEDFIFNK